MISTGFILGVYNNDIQFSTPNRNPFKNRWCPSLDHLDAMSEGLKRIDENLSRSWRVDRAHEPFYDGKKGTH